MAIRFECEDARLTKAMLGVKGEPEGGILGLVAQKLGLTSWQEYLNVDLVMYDESVLVGKGDFDGEQPDPPGTWAKRMEVVVEHENRAQTAWQEVVKLSYWQASLRVLVVYVLSNDELEGLLKCWSRILCGSLLPSDGFLVIFGEFSGRPPSSDSFVQWRPFVWNGTPFVPLTPSR